MFSPPDDVSTRLAAVLHPADLDRRPIPFRRLVEARLKGIGRPGEVEAECRIEGPGRGRVLHLRRRVGANGEWITVVIWADGKRVLGQVLDTGNDFETGWRPVAWRRSGSRLVGLNLDLHGNTSDPCVAVFEAKPGRWERRSLRVSPDEGWDIAFKGRGSWDVLVYRRNWDFRALSSSHAGPLLTDRAVWSLANGRYRARPFKRVPNALNAFDRLLDRADEGDSTYLRRTVPDPFVRQRLLAEVKATPGSRTVTCPKADMTERGRVFGIYGDKSEGHTPNWFFELALREGRWQVIRAVRESASSPAANRQESW